MSVSVRGDFAKLAKLQAKVKTLASDDRRIRLANVMGAAAVTEVQLGFRETRDPYGRAWAPLLLRQGGKPLLDTGRLRSSYSYQASMRGFTLGTNFIGAGVHQHGATITPKRAKFLRFKGKIHGRTRRTTGWIFAKSVTIPRRQMVPEGRLGPRWSKVFHETGARFFSRIMKA
jgi:phage gpG-like protein